MRAYAMTLPAFGAPAIGLANDPKCVEIIAAGLDAANERETHDVRRANRNVVSRGKNAR